MSIVEKAVNRAPRPERPRPGATTALVPGADARSAAQAPLVADVEALPIRRFVNFESNPGLARDFRFLKRPVLARVFGLSRSAQKAGNLVMLTSDLPQAGKSFVALNLAASIAQEQMLSVLLIDADPLRRTLTTRFDAQERAGLMEALANADTAIGDLILPTDVPSLRFLPAGQPRIDATELIAGPRMTEVLRSFNDPNLVVLLDSPPLLITSEARVIAEHVNHSLVVVESGRSTASDIGQILQLLQGSPASVSLILNKTPAAGASRYHDYYSY